MMNMIMFFFFTGSQFTVELTLAIEFGVPSRFGLHCDLKAVCVLSRR